MVLKSTVYTIVFHQGAFKAEALLLEILGFLYKVPQFLWTPRKVLSPLLPQVSCLLIEISLLCCWVIVGIKQKCTTCQNVFSRVPSIS